MEAGGQQQQDHHHHHHRRAAREMATPEVRRRVGAFADEQDSVRGKLLSVERRTERLNGEVERLKREKAQIVGGERGGRGERPKKQLSFELDKENAPPNGAVTSTPKARGLSARSFSSSSYSSPPSSTSTSAAAPQMTAAAAAAAADLECLVESIEGAAAAAASGAGPVPPTPGPLKAEKAARALATLRDHAKERQVRSRQSAY